MLIIFLLIAPSISQFASYLSLRLRLPGRCKEGDYDCGLGNCIPVRKFHDGRADCMDGSDEWCFFGHIRCGAYCVELKDSLGCLFNAKCDGSTRQPKFCEITKEKLCQDHQSFPCKGYGECILWHNLMDGRKDCIDGSDEDAEYVRSLENPFRCYFNRTGQIQPAGVIYSRPATLFPPVLTTPSLPLVPAAPLPGPPCPRCPPPFVFPHPTAHPFQASFPTLLPARPDPILPISSYSTIPSVPIQHITPVSVTQSEPGYGDFFPYGAITSPPVFPTRVDFTVEAHISTILPPTLPSLVTSSTEFPSSWTTDASAHIKVIPGDGDSSSGGQEATHINLGNGEISSGGSTSTSAPIKATTLPNGPADGIFFPIPVHPVTNLPPPAAIRPIPPPFWVKPPFHPIVPQPTSKPVDSITPDYVPPDHLIPIHPGIVVPTAPGEQSTTPKNPFGDSDEDYGGDLFGTAGPTVQVGIIPIDGLTSTPRPEVAETTTSSDTATVAVGVSEETTSYSSTTTEEESITSTEEPTTTLIPVETVNPVGVEDSKNSTCPPALLNPLREKYPKPYCECPSDDQEQCDRSRSTIFRLEKNEICRNDSSVKDEDKARVVLSMMRNSLPYTSCIDSNIDDGIIVSLNCSDCTLPLIQTKVEKINNEARGMHFEALNSSICDSDFNNCHRHADCVVDPSGLRFHCVCKNGTDDISNGKGWDCFGFPAEDDCILIFGICLIVWLLFLLGFLFCCPLVAYLCYSMNQRSRENIVHPVTTAVKTVTTRATSPKPAITNGSGTVMASALVDALRSNAKGMTAVSHSMTNRVRFTDEVTFPPNTVDWKPPSPPEKLPEPLPPPQTPKPVGMTSSSSEPKLSPMNEMKDAMSGVTALEYLIKQGSPVISPRVDAGETPILEQMRTPLDPMDRASVHSLPIPTIEIPGQTHKTSLDMGYLPSGSQPTSPTPILVTADVHHHEKGDTHSMASIGIQPTIWETYRAVGLVGTDDKGREDSSSSLDDLIGKKYQSRPTTAAAVKKDGESVPTLDLVTSPSEAVAPTVIPPAEVPAEEKVTTPQEEQQPVSGPRKKTSTTSNKLAEMLGVTPADDENDMKALSDMANEKIELPLEPIVTAIALNAAKVEEALMSLEQAVRKTPEAAALDAAVSKEILAAEKKEDQSKADDLRTVVAVPEPVDAEKFIPKAARRTPPKRTPALLAIPSRRRAPESSTESNSETEAAMRRRTVRDPNPFKDKKRRYRRPERQLSSISEKSAEIAADAAITESSPDDFTVSLPNTTRSLSDWHAHIPRHRRFDPSATEDTDPDIPHRFKRQPIISSPEIPDVTLKRSQERLFGAENGPKAQTTSRSRADSSSSSDAKRYQLPINRKLSRASVDGKARASTVSRKIASRKTEMRSAQSASDLTVEEQEIRSRIGLVSKRQKIARSEEYLARPRWDISPYRDGDERNLPPVQQRSSYSMREVRIAGAPLKNRTGSHTSLRSGSSVTFSPYFDPRDPGKPPKEELWWTPRDS